jgi:hypothetical protein
MQQYDDDFDLNDSKVCSEADLLELSGMSTPNLI